MDRTRKVRAGRFGSVPAFVTGDALDAGITASATVKVLISTPYRRAFVERATVIQETLPIGSGVITATLNRKPVGATAIALTAAIDLKTTTQVTLVAGLMALITTLTDAQRVINEGDILYVDVTAAGTVTTQPTQLSFIVELSVLE